MNVLIVDDEPIKIGPLVKRTEVVARCHVAGSAAQARDILDEKFEWAAFVLDEKLPDGNGRDVLAYARQKYPRTPATFFSGFLDDHVAIAGLQYGATLAPKGLEGLEWVIAFVRSSIASYVGEPDPVPSAARTWAEQQGLSAVEVDVFLNLLEGFETKEVAFKRGTTYRTVCTQESNICRKLREKTIRRAVSRFYREYSRELWLKARRGKS